MRYTIFIVLLLAINVSSAQSPPWVHAERTKTAYSFYGEEERLVLKFDTLRKTEPIEGSPMNFAIRTWLSGEDEKIGYGYVDPRGNYVGIWKYYIKKDNKYELFCEGSNVKLLPEDLEVQADLLKDFSSAGSTATKSDYINALKHPFLFAGEWRFYKNNKIDRLIILDRKSFIPYQVLGTDHSNSLILSDPGGNRHAGQVITSIHFHPNGFIRQIFTNGATIEFTTDGKAQLNPLQ